MSKFRPSEMLELKKPKELDLTYTSVQRIELNSKICIESLNEELCLIILEGDLDYSFGGEETKTAQKHDALYIPINSSLELSSENCVVMRYGAPCSRDTSFAHIKFDEVDGDSRHKVYGQIELGTKRDVWNYIDEKFDSSRFLIGMCAGRLGGWTAWPPHEHGEKREEVYVYTGMGDGFGIQCVYDELSETHGAEIVQDGDVIPIAKGYHPSVGCPKSGIAYFYVMVSTTAEDRDFMDLIIPKEFGDKLE